MHRPYGRVTVPRGLTAVARNGASVGLMRLRRAEPHGTRGDVVAVGAGAGLIGAAAVVGGLLVGRGVPVHAGAAPLFALVRPYASGYSLVAVVLGVAAVWCLPGLAYRLAWPLLLGVVAAVTAAWTAVLAFVRGPGGLLDPLAAAPEYLAEVPRIAHLSLHDYLSGFVANIPVTADHPWRTHVAGHPPGLTLVFVLLDRLGLGGRWPAAALCLLAWAVGVVAVAGTVRRLAGEPAARAALPYLVLSPAVVWAGVSADAVVAGTGAVGLYVLARAMTGRRAAAAWAAGAGGVLGACCFLSYGAPLLAFPALAVAVAARRAMPHAVAMITVAALAALAVVLAFRLGGFAWWDGYIAVRARYFAGFGAQRPYGYWVWADLAALAVATGPAVHAGLGRLRHYTGPVRILVLGSLVAVLAATLSGMSKAEVERIWLPWILWLPVACVALPSWRMRPWLAAQVGVALLLEHLLLTPW